MNQTELAELALKARKLRDELDEIETQLRDAVVDMAATLKLPGVITVSYYKPRYETPDYEAAAKGAMPDDFDLTPYQTVKISTQWKGVCAALGVEAQKGALKPPRAVVKYQ